MPPSSRQGVPRNSRAVFFQHHAELFSQGPGVCLGQLPSRAYTHFTEALSEPPTNPPDFVYRHGLQQFVPPLWVGDVHHAAGLSLPAFRGKVGEFRQRLGRSNADSSGNARCGDNLGADLPPHAYPICLDTG